MAIVIKKIVATVGEYQTTSGERKKKYQTVGTVLKNEDGSLFALMDKTFNPAGVNNGKDSVLLNFYEIDSNQKSNNRPSPAVPQFNNHEELPF